MVQSPINRPIWSHCKQSILSTLVSSQSEKCLSTESLLMKQNCLLANFPSTQCLRPGHLILHFCQRFFPHLLQLCAKMHTVQILQLSSLHHFVFLNPLGYLFTLSPSQLTYFLFLSFAKLNNFILNGPTSASILFIFVLFKNN